MPSTQSPTRVLLAHINDDGRHRLLAYHGTDPFPGMDSRMPQYHLLLCLFFPILLLPAFSPEMEGINGPVLVRLPDFKFLRVLGKRVN